MILLTYLWVYLGVVHGCVFTAAAIGLGYGAASGLFRLFPVSFAGPEIGTGWHAVTWAVAVVAAEQVGRRGHVIFLMTAVKISDPSARVLKGELTPEALVTDVAEFDLGVVVTILVAVNVVLAVVTVNDTHGHLAGDEALVEVTDTIRDQLRASDVAGRFGGEEFVLLLPDTDEKQAVKVAERIRRHIAGLAIPLGNGQAVRLTVSAGVAPVDGLRRELKALVAAADAAVYRAKEAGRNQTWVTPATSPAGLGQPAGPRPHHERHDELE